MATYPGEWADDYRRKVLSDVTGWKALHDWLFAGEVDEVSGKPRSLFSNRLVLTDQSFVDSEKLDKVEVSRSFRGRDLRGAVLNRPICAKPTSQARCSMKPNSMMRSYSRRVCGARESPRGC